MLTEDQAFFQFGFQLDKNEKICDLRYAYYEVPTRTISYEEYLIKEGLNPEECGDIFLDDFDQYKTETLLKKSVTSIRYDFSVSQYDKIQHPISHLHIGQQNEIRIPISLIMTAKTFVAFVLRHVYWNKWKFYIDDPIFQKLYLSSKQPSDSLNIEQFCAEEKLDLYMA